MDDYGRLNKGFVIVGMWIQRGENFSSFAVKEMLGSMKLGWLGLQFRKGIRSWGGIILGSVALR